MEHIDEQILESRKVLKRQKYTSLESGIYAGEELITFAQLTLPDSEISIFIPDQFILMPDQIKNMKYPSKDAPDIVLTSIDSVINIGFNVLPIQINEGDTKAMSLQFQDALKNVNPSIKIKNAEELVTEKGYEVNRFEFKGYVLDGQIYNQMYMIKLKKTVLHSIFNCPMNVKENWVNIIEKCFMSIEKK